MSQITRRQILESQYNDLYSALEISKLIVKALKTLPQEMELEPRHEKSPYGIVEIKMTVGQRIQELERDIKVLTARLKVVEEELENEKKQATN